MVGDLHLMALSESRFEKWGRCGENGMDERIVLHSQPVPRLHAHL